MEDSINNMNSSHSKSSKSKRKEKAAKPKMAMEDTAPICSVDLFMDANVSVISVKTQMSIQSWEAFKSRRPV